MKRPVIVHAVSSKGIAVCGVNSGKARLSLLLKDVGCFRCITRLAAAL